MTRPSPSRRATRRFAAARDHERRKQALILAARRAAFRRGMLAIKRLDWSRFNIGLKEAGDAMRRFLLAAQAALPECAVDGCKRRHRPGCVLPGTGRVCAFHFMVGTGTMRPRGILDAALEQPDVLKDGRVQRALAEFADVRRTERQLEKILAPKPKTLGASGRVSSIAIHVQPPALPHSNPAHLDALAHSRAVRAERHRR